MTTHFTRYDFPPGFYVYAYLRKSGSPYYIGKGKGDRAWRQHRYKRAGVHTPLDERRIVIISYDLTEIGSFAMERRMIAWYGRKDYGTGSLHNRTDGGDGGSGRFVSDTERKLRSELMSGDKHPLKGKPHSAESNQKRSETQRGVPRSEQARKNMIAAGEKRRTNRDATVYHWQHIKTGEEVNSTIYDFCKTYDLDWGSVWNVIKGVFKSTGDWRLYSEQPYQRAKAPPRDPTIYHWRNKKTGEEVMMTRYQLTDYAGPSYYGKVIAGKEKSANGWEIIR